MKKVQIAQENCSFYYKIQKILNNSQYIAPALKRIAKATSDGARNLLWLGGTRSLKTSSMMQLVGWHLTGVYPDGGSFHSLNKEKYVYDGYRFEKPTKILVVSLTNLQSRDITQQYLINGEPSSGRKPDLLFYTDYILKPGIKGLYEKIFIPHFSSNGEYNGNSELIFKSVEEGAGNFQGFNGIDCVFMDEEPRYDVFKECLNRLAGIKDRKTFLFLSQWAGKGKTELVKYFIEGKDKDVVNGYTFYTQSGWDDNPFLSKDEITKMEQDYPAWELPARKYGQPVFGQGKVFEFLISDIITDDIALDDIPMDWNLIGGIDPSATSNGTWGACLLAEAPDGTIYIMQEYLTTNKRLDEHGDNIRVMFSFLPGIPLVCDPAGGGENYERQSALEYLREEEKLNIIVAEKANQAKNHAINKIYLLKRNNKFKICKKCVKTLEEFDQYARDEKNKIIKQNDHIIDACFYALNKIGQARSKNLLYGISKNTDYRNKTKQGIDYFGNIRGVSIASRNNEYY